MFIFFAIAAKKTNQKKRPGQSNASTRPAGSSRFFRAYAQSKAKPAFPPYVRPARSDIWASAFLLLILSLPVISTVGRKLVRMTGGDLCMMNKISPPSSFEMTGWV